MPKTVKVVDHLGLREAQDCYKGFKIGKTLHKRYSRKAVDAISEALRHESAEDIWAKHRGRRSAA